MLEQQERDRRLRHLLDVYYLADVRAALRAVGLALSPKQMRQIIRLLERQGLVEPAPRGFDGERQWTANEAASMVDAVRRYLDGHGETIS